MIVAMVLGFVSGGAGTYYGIHFWNSRIMHDPDATLGINFFLLAFAAATIGTVVAGIVVGRWLWPMQSPPEDEGNQPPQS
jgi:Na+/glutamate symporter